MMSFERKKERKKNWGLDECRKKERKKFLGMMSF